MNLIALSIKSFRFYFKQNLLIAIAVGITASVITGSLLIGDSIKQSLTKTVEIRLGNVTHVLQGNGRFFSSELSKKLSSSLNCQTTSILQTNGSLASTGGNLKLNQVLVYGIDTNFFSNVYNANNPTLLNNGEILVSSNVAEALTLTVGDLVQLNLSSLSLIPVNTPLASVESQNKAVRVKIAGIIDSKGMGRFSLQQMQTEPYNVFIRHDWLAKQFGIQNMANLVLISNSHGLSHQAIANEVSKSISLTDANLSLHVSVDSLQWQIKSDKIFIDTAFSSRLLSQISSAQPILTYFVNQFEYQNKRTPYSFVSATPTIKVDSGCIVINNWLASDLGVKLNDTLQLEFYSVESNFNLSTQRIALKISEIVPISDIYADTAFMPQIPGLTDAGNCRDWDAGIPIDFTQIRPADEQYWQNHKGLPKAFLNLNQAKLFWTNRFGAFTTIKGSGHVDSIQQQANQIIQANSINKLGYSVENVREQGIWSASNGVSFSELFLSLSFFIVISGVLLTYLIFAFTIEVRRNQLKTLWALGWNRRRIILLLTYEQALVAVLGLALGLILSIAFQSMVFKTLAQIWQAIVRTNLLTMYYSVSQFTIGLTSTFVIVMLSVAFTINRQLNGVKKNKKSVNLTPNRSIQTLPFEIFLFLVAIILLFNQFYIKNSSPLLFVLSGVAWLVLFWRMFYLAMNRYLQKTELSGQFIMLKTHYLKPLQAVTTVILLSLSIFIIMATGANQNTNNKQPQKTDGTGGFATYSEFLAPITEDLNLQEVKLKYNLTTANSFVLMPRYLVNDASCLNLNRIQNPTILGVNPDDLSGRFTFVKYLLSDYAIDPWQSLNHQSGNIVPAIADQTVIQWGLGKNLGDTLTYLNARGDSLKIVLVASIEPSIFQGNIIICDKQFYAHFPYNQGYHIVLSQSHSFSTDSLENELDFAFKHLGIQSTTTKNRLNLFKSIERTYLSIFMYMGLLGLLLGTIGYLAFLARAIYQQKKQTAMFLALGFTKKHLFKLMLIQNSAILVWGLLAGTLASIVAVFPTVLAKPESLWIIMAMFFLMLIHGFLWLVFLLKWHLNRININIELRIQE